MKILMKGLILGVASSFIIACSSSTPKCSDDKTKEVLINNVKHEIRDFWGDMVDLNNVDFKVNNIITVDHQKDIDKYTCKGDLIQKDKRTGETRVTPITYTVQKTDDGKNIHVEIK